MIVTFQGLGIRCWQGITHLCKHKDSPSFSISHYELGWVDNRVFFLQVPITNWKLCFYVKSVTAAEFLGINAQSIIHCVQIFRMMWFAVEEQMKGNNWDLESWSHLDKNLGEKPGSHIPSVQSPGYRHLNNLVSLTGRKARNRGIPSTQNTQTHGDTEAIQIALILRKVPKTC